MAWAWWGQDFPEKLPALPVLPPRPGSGKRRGITKPPLRKRRRRR